MNTSLTDRDTVVPPPPSHGGRRFGAVLGAAAAVAIAVTGIAVVLTGGDDGGGDEPVADGPPLELSLGQGDALASCLAFDVNTLAGMSPAFAATATSVEGESVTLTVDRWYTGGDAGTVVLDAPAGMEALIAGFDFEAGDRYLITATDGVVNYCGYSGPATPDLTDAFEQAFPG